MRSWHPSHTCPRRWRKHRPHRGRERISASIAWPKPGEGADWPPDAFTRAQGFASTTCGSLLIAEGVRPKFVQAILRHSKISTTMDLYVHAYDEDLGGAVASLDRPLGREAYAVTWPSNRRRADLGSRNPCKYGGL